MSDPTPVRASERALLNRDFVLLWLSQLAFLLSFQGLLTALPLYTQSLGASAPQIGLITGLFAGSAMLLRLPIGGLLDRGRKVLILAIGAGVFALASAGYALASSVTLILALRVLHGTGMAAYQTAGQTLVVEVAPDSRRGEALGVYGISANLATAFGPALGLAIATAIGYTALFGTASIMALIALGLCLAIVEPPSRHLPSASARGIRSLHTVFRVEVVGPGVALLSLMLTYGAIVSFLPFYALERGLSNAGLFFMASSIGMLAAQSVAGRLSDRFGRSAALVPGLIIASLGLVLVANLGGDWLLLAGAVYGVGFGFAQPATFAAGSDLVPPAARGAAMGTLGLFLEAGISTGAILSGLMVTPLGIGTTFLLIAVTPLIGVAVTLIWRWGAPSNRTVEAARELVG